MITRTLLEYIQREQSMGKTRERIITKLKEKGWKDEDIASAFKSLSDEGELDVPMPRKGTLAEFQEMLFLMWGVYRSRWQRFFGAGLAYFFVLLFLSIAMFRFVMGEIPLFLGLVATGDTSAAFSLVAPFLLSAVCVYVLVELWYIGTLYSIALRKGGSLLERLKVGLCHLPAVLGIRVVIAIILLISMVPLFLVAFLTQDPLTFVFFGPLFIFWMFFLGFLFSFAVPAYFHGISWKGASLHSVRIVSKYPLAILVFYTFFGVLVLLATLLFRHTGVIAVIASIGLIFPMKALFMCTLYRRFVPEEMTPATTPPSLPSSEIEKEPSPLSSLSLPKKRTQRIRRTIKAPTA